jgi:DNA-binding MarR family transcriptional regulator
MPVCSFRDILINKSQILRYSRSTCTVSQALISLIHLLLVSASLTVLEFLVLFFLDKRPSGPALLKKQGVLGLPVLQRSNEITSSQKEIAAGQQLGGSLSIAPSSLSNNLEQTRNKPKKKRT